MSKIAEKILILLDVNRGLLARTHYLTAFERPAILDAEVEKFCQRLKKKWPSVTENLEKLNGYSLFRDRSIEILATLEDFFMHIVNLIQFKKKALVLLNEIASKILEFSPEAHLELMAKYFELFVGLVQLHILSSSLPNLQEYVIIYTYAWGCSKPSANEHWIEVRDYVDSTLEPIKNIRLDCENLGYHLSQALHGVQDIYINSLNYETLWGNDVFNLIQSPNTLGITEENPFYKHVQYAGQIRNWILYVYLVCPSELQNESCRELLQWALSDGFLLSVYRDSFLRIHEHFDRLFNEYKLKKFKLSKFKDLVKNATTTAIQDSPRRHRTFRNFLRAEIKGLIQLIYDVPGVLGPKMDVIWAAIRLLKQEILFNFSHTGTEAPKTKAKYNAQDWSDENISELFYLLDELIEIVKEHHTFIRDFAIEFIQSKLTELEKLVNDLSQSASLGQNVKQRLDVLLDILEEGIGSHTFVELRRFWHSTLVIFSEANSGMTSRAAKNLLALMDTIIFHTRNFDDIDELLVENGSLHVLWYDLDNFIEVFNECLILPGSRPRHFIAMLKFLNTISRNCHRYAPEEQAFNASHSTEIADTLLYNVATHVEGVVNNLFAKEIWLLKQTIPSSAAMRMRDQLEDRPVNPLPGYESLYANRFSVEEVADTRIYKTNAAAILEAIRRTPEVRVYNTIFNGKEYIRQMIVSAFRKRLKKMISTNKRGLERPSIFLMKIGRLFSGYEFIATHLNIAFADIAKYVLLSESYDPRGGHCGQGFDFRSGDLDVDMEVSGEDLGNLKLIHQLSIFFVDFVSARLDQLGILYSGYHQGFINDTFTGAVSVDPNLDELYVNTINYIHDPELRAMCQYIGGYGVRFMDRQLLVLLAYEIESLMSILEKNRSVLAHITPRLTQTNFWAEGVRKLEDIDELMEISLKISVILKFRKMLFRAYQDVLKERVPFYSEGIKDLFQRLSNLRGAIQSPQFAEFCGLLRDTGCSIDETHDRYFLDVLRKFKSTRAQGDIWALLPELYGYMYVSTLWSQALYVVNANAYNNNAHCIRECIVTLISGFNSIIIADTTTGPSDQGSRMAVKESLRRFVRFSSYSMLHMVTQNANDPTQWAGYKLNHMQIFLDYFINSVPGLEIGYLEDVFPYTLLRTAAIQLAESQTEAGKLFAVSVEDEKEDN